MNKLFILAISLSFVLSAGTAMAADQASETFQTLGQMQTVEMTDTELNDVEGKMRSKGYKGYRGRGHKGGLKLNLRANFNTTEQVNSCVACFAQGGRGGGGNINQINDNLTVQN